MVTTIVYGELGVLLVPAVSVPSWMGARLSAFTQVGQPITPAAAALRAAGVEENMMLVAIDNEDLTTVPFSRILSAVQGSAAGRCVRRD